MLYLAPIVGTGKRADPFRPRGVDGTRGWGMLDLRDDCTRPGWCYVWSEDRLTLERGTVRIGCDPLEAMTRAAVIDTRSRLGVCTQGRRLLRDLLAKLLFWRWCKWGNVVRWNPVLAENWTGLREIWIAGKLWAWTQSRPKCCPDYDPSDTFVRANETPLAAPWTKQTGTGASAANINLASNAIQSSAAGDKFYYYSGAANHADQWSEIRQNAAVTNNDWGAAVRIGASNFSGYWKSNFTTSKEFDKFVSGSFTQIAVCTGLATIANGDLDRFQVTGSSLSSYRNGTQVPNSPQTDTSLSTAGNGVGIFLYDTGGGLNNWQGGNLRPGPWYDPNAGLRAMLATM